VFLQLARCGLLLCRRAIGGRYELRGSPELVMAAVAPSADEKLGAQGFQVAELYARARVCVSGGNG